MGELHGALALVGSGEYTPAMRATDGWLLATLGGPRQARVALIPTASALEQGQPARWNGMGAAHFGELGAATTPLGLLRREDASDPALTAALREANFFYFSGGNPEYLAATIEESPAWAAIAAAYRTGAVVAGCSAGAMILGSYLLRVRAVRAGQGPFWRQGLGLAEGLAIMPHFDRMGRLMDRGQFAAILAAVPCGITVVGVDEDTALVRLPRRGEGPYRWQVMGRQSVSVFGECGEPTVYRSGEKLALG